MKEKEPLKDSGRMKLFVGGLLLEVLIAVMPMTGLNIPLDVLEAVAYSAAGLVGAIILARTQRNTV